MVYDSVVFDMDGVIVRPTDDNLIREAVEQAFHECNIDDPPADDVGTLCQGAALGVEKLKRVCRKHGLDPDRFWRVRERYAAQMQLETVRAGVKPLYDDADVLESLDQCLGLVSNNQHRTVEGILDFYGIDGLFHTICGRPPTYDGIRYTKPDPHHLHSAVDSLGTDDLLFVGDSNVDVEAATEAGLDSAFIRRPHREAYELRGDPTYRIGSLQDLKRIV